MKPGEPAGEEVEVAITGAGLHGAFGDLEASQVALTEGRSAVVPFELTEAQGFPALVGAPAAAFDIKSFLPDRKARKFMNGVCDLAVVAAGRALDRAGLRGHGDRCADMALLMSTGLIAFDLTQIMHLRGDLTDEEGAFDLGKMGRQGIRACHPLMPFKMLLNMPLGMVSIVYGIRGENVILYPGPAQAAVCLDKALRGIRQGRFVRALVGGSAQLLSLMPLSTQLARGQLAATESACQTGAAHAGLAPADAAAFVVLESADLARERGAPVIGLLDSVELGCNRSALGATADAQPVDEVWLTGSDSAERDGQEADWLASRTQTRDARVRRCDPLFGHAGAAALPFNLALACTASSESRRAWIASSDPDGLYALVRARLGEEVPA